ncbi:PLP-dependent aminotransferase family protein [Azospirillum cavernae]|uniref:PLP-dependent aminotransferase family protein n=1 Tax=Azospirillum cavernae TaxID=2320860 RepID=A0A418VZT0_9PROT|nr:PLP-dependent aminotransferase family protein [Azospirillum cavernae]RJF83280.1 PLP-dependent aminotransferase family protein [Azospirillum cavernae]
MVAARFPEVVERLAREIRDGLLPPGSRMPTHRALAERFGLAPATASRVYEELGKRGLVSGEVGRGTFVRGVAQHSMTDLGGSAVGGADRSATLSQTIDLSVNYPILDGQDALLGDTLRQLADEKGVSGLLGYQAPAGRPRDRQAAAAWLAACGLVATPDDILVTTGAQHGIAVALMTVCSPGDSVAVESLTYPGVKILAGLLNLHLAPIEMDAQGLVPRHLEEVCRSRRIRAVYCMPTVHNPLGLVMPEERRRQIVAICRKHDVFLLEDDAYAFLQERPPTPLRSLAPERCFNIQSLAKAFAPGLRIGYLVAPTPLMERAESVIRSTTWTASPITAELASRWIHDGWGERLVTEKRQDAAERQTLVSALLPTAAIQSHPTSYHVWLRLPPGVRGDDFVRHLKARNVIVSPSAAFVVPRRHAASAVRIAMGGVSVERLRDGLRIVAELYGRLRPMSVEAGGRW